MVQEQTVRESSREIPVQSEYDVVVVGGGMAGVAAAIAAAKHAARVCLIERYCALGGLATLGNVAVWLPLCDGRGHQVISGLAEELLKLSVADLKTESPSAWFLRPPVCWQAGGDLEERIKHRYKAAFNPASMILGLEKLVVESGISLLYDTRFCAVHRENNRLSHVVVENKSGRVALAGKVFIDATGDADVCFAAGEKTESLDSNVLAGWFYTMSSGALTLHKLTHVYNTDGTRDHAQGPFFRGDNGSHVSAHIVESRTLVRERLAELRSTNPSQEFQPIMPATLAAHRMTRRLAADICLTEQDAHHWFEDAIGLSGDWHHPGPVYAVPLRALQGVSNPNLLAAGRCISAGGYAWENLRAIAPCAVTGEAAGTAAALAVRETSGNIATLNVPLLQKELKRQGVLIEPGLVEAA